MAPSAKRHAAQPPPPPTTMPPPAPSIDTLLFHFTSTLRLHPRPTWLSQSLSSQRQLPAGPALLASLKFRILASDITESLQPHANLCFPLSAHDSDAKSVTLPGPIAVQVVAVEDVGVSRVEQIDKIEMAERGEIQRGREVIRVVPEGDGDGIGTQAGTVQGEQKVKTGPCKVLLEDAGGRRVYGIELKAVEGVKSDMAIGAKVCSSFAPLGNRIRTDRIWRASVGIEERRCGSRTASTDTRQHNLPGRQNRSPEPSVAGRSQAGTPGYDRGFESVVNHFLRVVARKYINNTKNIQVCSQASARQSLRSRYPCTLFNNQFFSRAHQINN